LVIDTAAFEAASTSTVLDVIISNMTESDISGAINMTVHDLSVQSLNDFYSKFGVAFIEHEVNRAADTFVHALSFGYEITAMQSPCITNILKQFHSFKRQNPNVANILAINDITTNDILRAIRMTMNVRVRSYSS
jgi:hypothetical protein